MEFDDNPSRQPSVQPSVKVESESDIAELTERVGRVPGRDYMSSRPGAKGKTVYYLSGERSTQLANEAFGVPNWSCQVINVTVDETDVANSVVTVYASACVRVTCLIPNKYGRYAFHEDIGTGFSQVNVPSHIKMAQSKSDAMDRAKKSAVTDARKRALSQFGPLLGMFLKDPKAVQFCLKSGGGPPPYSAYRPSGGGPSGYNGYTPSQVDNARRPPERQSFFGSTGEFRAYSPSAGDAGTRKRHSMQRKLGDIPAEEKDMLLEMADEDWEVE